MLATNESYKLRMICLKFISKVTCTTIRIAFAIAGFARFVRFNFSKMLFKQFDVVIDSYHLSSLYKQHFYFSLLSDNQKYAPTFLFNNPINTRADPCVVAAEGGRSY